MYINIYVYEKLYNESAGRVHRNDISGALYHLKTTDTLKNPIEMIHVGRMPPVSGSFSKTILCPHIVTCNADEERKCIAAI